MNDSIKRLILNSETYGGMVRKGLYDTVDELNYSQRGYALRLILNGISPQKALESATRFLPDYKEKP